MAPGKTLDLAFTVDCTASMSKYIEQARQVDTKSLVSHVRVRKPILIVKETMKMI